MPGMGYQQPQPYYPRELETLKGLKHINWGIVLYIVATLLLLLTALVAVATAISLAGTSDPTPYLGALVGLAALACGGLFLYLITIVLWLLGIYEMNKGKDEFGSEHSANVSRAVILIVLFVVFAVISIVVTMVLAISWISPTVTPSEVIDSLRLSVLISGVIGIITTAMLGLAIVYLVISLCEEKYKKILWAAFAVNMILTVVGTAIAIVVVYGDLSYITDISEITSMSSAGDLARGMSFIAFILFLLAYRHAYNRVRTGAIQPAPMQFQQMGPLPPPPVPYPRAGPPGAAPPPNVCPMCNSPVVPGETFCANCGARLQG